MLRLRPRRHCRRCRQAHTLAASCYGFTYYGVLVQYRFFTLYTLLRRDPTATHARPAVFHQLYALLPRHALSDGGGDDRTKETVCRTKS